MTTNIFGGTALALLLSIHFASPVIAANANSYWEDQLFQMVTNNPEKVPDMIAREEANAKRWQGKADAAEDATDKKTFQELADSSKKHAKKVRDMDLAAHNKHSNI